jgi:hypothetical protein
MEERALLTSAAATAAIFAVQQTQLDLQLQVAQEMNTLKNNSVSIQNATNVFIRNVKSDILSLRQDAASNPANRAADNAAIAADERNIKNAMRDEKFAIGQQNDLIRQLGKLDKQINSTASAEINGLKRGRIDPGTVDASIVTFTETVQTSIMTIDTQATNDLVALTSTLDSGTA